MHNEFIIDHDSHTIYISESDFFYLGTVLKYLVRNACKCVSSMTATNRHGQHHFVRLRTTVCSCNWFCHCLLKSAVSIPFEFIIKISIISCRRIARRDLSLTSRDSDTSARDSLIALGSMKHRHAVLDEAFFYDFLSLSIEFNKRNLDAYVRVNNDPNFYGFTKSQSNTLLEKWIYAMLATGYWSTVTLSNSVGANCYLFTLDWQKYFWVF